MVLMFQTDLHNPNLDPSKRMKLEEFISNNRGINGGKNLPRDFLERLYFSIKRAPLALSDDPLALAAASTAPTNDTGGGDGDGAGAGEKQDAAGAAAGASAVRRANSVALASFTPATTARKHVFPAGVHEVLALASPMPTDAQASVV